MDDLLESVGKVAGEIVVESVLTVVVGGDTDKVENTKSTKVKKSCFSDYLLILAAVLIITVLVGGFIALLWLFVF